MARPAVIDYGANMGMQYENTYRRHSHSMTLISFAFAFEFNACFKTENLKYRLKFKSYFYEIIKKAQAQLARWLILEGV